MHLEEKVTRKEFLQKVGFGALALMLLARVPMDAEAAPKATLFEDNLSSGAGAYQGETPPASTKQMWLNKGSDDNTYGANGVAVPNGALCYYDEEGAGWVPTTTTWS